MTLQPPLAPELTMQSGRDLHLYNEIGEDVGGDTSQTSMGDTP